MNTNREISLTPKEIKEICSQYEYVYDPFTEEDIKTRKLKLALSTLDRGDFVIACLYAELHSERKVAALFSCSAPTIHKVLKSIREQITKKIEEYDAIPDFDC